LTSGGGITIGAEGISLAFPKDPTNVFGVGAITNLSTINGAAYPPPAYVLPADITVSTLTAATNVSTIAITGLSTINGAAYPPLAPTVKQATYYNSVSQNLTSVNTDLTFDSTGAWNNAGGYITHTNGTVAFTVVQAGLYQLEFNAQILVNNGTWSATVSRGIFIDITRSPTAEQAVIGNTALQAVANYNVLTSASFYLVAGDVINCRVNNPYTLGTPTPPQASGLTNTIDLNTFFSWRFIS
jgi:hypothetical protein